MPVIRPGAPGHSSAECLACRHLGHSRLPFGVAQASRCAVLLFRSRRRSCPVQGPATLSNPLKTSLTAVVWVKGRTPHGRQQMEFPPRQTLLKIPPLGRGTIRSCSPWMMTTRPEWLRVFWASGSRPRRSLSWRYYPCARKPGCLVIEPGRGLLLEGCLSRGQAGQGEVVQDLRGIALQGPGIARSIAAGWPQGWSGRRQKTGGTATKTVAPGAGPRSSARASRRSMPPRDQPTRTHSWRGSSLRYWASQPASHL